MVDPLYTCMWFNESRNWVNHHWKEHPYLLNMYRKWYVGQALCNCLELVVTTQNTLSTCMSVEPVNEHSAVQAVMQGTPWWYLCQCCMIAAYLTWNSPEHCENLWSVMFGSLYQACTTNSICMLTTSRTIQLSRVRHNADERVHNDIAATYGFLGGEMIKFWAIQKCCFMFQSLTIICCGKWN